MAKFCLWMGLAFVVLGFASCVLGVGGSLGAESSADLAASADLASWGVYGFFGGLLLIVVGAVLKAFSK